jgi:hypothetical protein
VSEENPVSSFKVCRMRIFFGYRQVHDSDSGFIAAGLLTDPRCLGIEPCLGSWPDCYVHTGYICNLS